MQAKDQYLLEFLEQVHQLTIPIYQRKYSWTNKQCKQLFEDILRIGESNERTHFMGAIVFKQYYDRISKKIIIDGQQRITTLNLLIAAVVDFLLKNDIEELDTDAEEMMNSYLLNAAKKGENNYKLILTMDDKTTLIKIIDNLRNENQVDFNDNDSERLQDNYNFFKRKITEDNVEYIIEGLGKLLIVYMELTDFDNPQLIFESMNSTGLDLNKSDLIRNYLLMGLDAEEQYDLYNNYWHDIELIFEKNNYSFDEFIKAYLTLKYDRVIRGDLYEAFKKYSRNFNIDELVKDIYEYAQYFTKIVLNKEENKNLNNAFQSLNKLKNLVIHPFLLRLYKDYNSGILEANDFIEMVKYTESYVFRRFICELDSQSLRKTYAEMYKSLNEDNYLESYKYVLFNKSGHRRMPDDEEFERSLISRDIYNLKSNNRYLLGKLENYNSKEITNVFTDNIQIEHIMPQTITPEWKDELGDNWENVHKLYVHTLGNLTLTGYNQELSNKSFQEKRDMEDGFKESQIKLNRYLSELSHWNEAEIIKRRDYLIEKSKMIWTFPEISEEILEKYKKLEESKKVKKTPDIDREKFFTEYWDEFYDYLEEENKHFVYPKPLPHNWFALYFGTSLAHIEFKAKIIQANEINVHFRIKKNSNEIFDKLLEEKETIESEIGFELEWDKSENNNISKIGKTLELDITDKSNWNESIEWCIHMANKLYDVFSDRIKEF